MPPQRWSSLPGPEWGERVRCDGEVVYDNAMRKEGRCGQDDHGRVDRPAHAHRKERVEELIAQTFLDNLLALAFEVHGLDDLGVQEEVVRHNDRAWDTYDNRGRAGGHTGRDPACGGLRPVDLDQRKLSQKRESYHAYEGDDPSLRRACRSSS